MSLKLNIADDELAFIAEMYDNKYAIWQIASTEMPFMCPRIIIYDSAKIYYKQGET